MQLKLQTNITRMSAMLDLMDGLELDTTVLRSDLMTTTMDLGTGLTDTGVALRLINRARKNRQPVLLTKDPVLWEIHFYACIVSLFRIASRFIPKGLHKVIGVTHLNLSDLARGMLTFPVLKDPEPIVRLHNLGSSSVDFVVRPWIKVADYWVVYWDVTGSVKLRFDEVRYPYLFHSGMYITVLSRHRQRIWRRFDRERQIPKIKKESDKMKKMTEFSTAVLIVMVLLFVTPVAADKFADTLAVFSKSDVVQPLLKEAYGYAVFPTIGKGGIGIGGAYGKGQVYKGGNVTGETSLVKATIGFQLGGQAFSQLILFQDKRAYDDFTSGNFEFDATASAVAITAGAQASAGSEGASAGASAGPATGKQAKAGYHKGMAVFVHTKGGLMYEAAIGGQKFSFKAKEDKK